MIYVVVGIALSAIAMLITALARITKLEKDVVEAEKRAIWGAEKLGKVVELLDPYSERDYKTYHCIAWDSQQARTYCFRLSQALKEFEEKAHMYRLFNEIKEAESKLPDNSNSEC